MSRPWRLERDLDGHDVTEIEENLWMGACPAPELPAFFRYVLNLYPRQPYGTHSGTVVRTHAMDDSFEVQGTATLEELADWVNEKRAIGATLVHCQAGLNRSGLVTALALIRSGVAPATAIARLRKKRSQDVLFNTAFERWLMARSPRAAAASNIPGGHSDGG